MQATSFSIGTQVPFRTMIQRKSIVQFIVFLDEDDLVSYESFSEDETLIKQNYLKVLSRFCDTVCLKM